MPISFGPLGVHREPASRTMRSIALIPCCPVIPAAEIVFWAGFFRLERAVKEFVPHLGRYYAATCRLSTVPERTETNCKRAQRICLIEGVHCNKLRTKAAKYPTKSAIMAQ